MVTSFISLAVIIPALWLGYTGRALWSARKAWPGLTADTKAFYLLVAPPLILALDILIVTDRLFYWPADRRYANAGQPL